jgi:tetratricopeptide (TPR) repeat protein
MKLIQVAFILLMLMVPVYGQQTAADWYSKGNDWHAKGDALRDQGMPDEANNAYDEIIKAYDEALKLDPTNSTIWLAKGDALSSRAGSNDMGKYDEAVKCYDEAIKIDPKNTITWEDKGVALDNQGNYSEAIKCYDEIIRLEPKNANAWRFKAHALSSLGKYDDAGKALDKAFELLDPHAETNWNLWDEKAGIQKGVARTYYLKEFFTNIDGNGVTFFLSFMGKDGKTYAIPEGKLLITLYRGKSTAGEIYTHIYDIKKSDYGNYAGGVAIKKWISVEEMSISTVPSAVNGRFGFQDVTGLVSTARKETPL